MKQQAKYILLFSPVMATAIIQDLASISTTTITTTTITL